VRQTHRPIQPNRARIRRAKGKGIGKALQERPLDPLTVSMKEAGNAAQSLCLSMRVTLFERRKADAACHIFLDTNFAQFRRVRSLRRTPPRPTNFMS
jgi:hypothetical protein